eukprot:2301793-Amphidinium_carterae.1
MVLPTIRCGFRKRACVMASLVAVITWFVPPKDCQVSYILPSSGCDLYQLREWCPSESRYFA